MANEFLAFASGASANVLTPAEYAALTSIVENGFSSGILTSERLNTVLRQAAFVAAAIGQIVSDTGVDASDDGNLSVLKTRIVTALGVGPGHVIFIAKNSAPNGFLKANGSAVSRATYSALYNAIGTTFGVGDGSTTFNLPDLRGEFIRGWDDSRGVDTGRVFGAAQSGMIEAHVHDGTISPVSQTGASGSAVYVSTGNATTGSYGGAETRPRNIALLACIKY